MIDSSVLEQFYNRLIRVPPRLMAQEQQFPFRYRKFSRVSYENRCNASKIYINPRLVVFSKLKKSIYVFQKYQFYDFFIEFLVKLTLVK